jgi:glycosyltransferase involved in cell wall biosynthesis
MAPLVVQEAKSVCLPVLGSNVPGITEQIEHGKNGFIFPFNDYLKLRSQIADILANPDLLVKIQANITQPRNFEMVASETLEVYNSICNTEQC